MDYAGNSRAAGGRVAKNKPEKRKSKPAETPAARKPHSPKAASKQEPEDKAKPRTAGPKEPSRPTVKRLFAVSRNRCAFAKCRGRIVDPESGSIIGEICHIKGEKPGAKRYDRSQLDRERHGFNNLILLCGVHHKVIDDDDKKHTVERLLAMKQKHESGQPNDAALTNAQADQLIVRIHGNSVKDGSIIQTQHQSGGQAAHVINNYNRPPPEDDSIVVDGSLCIAGDMGLLQTFGCPGLQLTVACRSKRPAKIRHATLSVEGRGFVEALQAGWGVPFGHNPPEGMEAETLSIEFARISRPNSPEGYSLNRDEVCRFYLPLLSAPLGVFLTAPTDNVSVRVVFFDDSERIILRAEEVQGLIRDLVEAHGRGPYSLKTHAKVSVRVKSATRPPDLWPITGTTNQNPVSFATPDQRHRAAAQAHVQADLGVVQVHSAHEFTLGVRIINSGQQPVDHVAVTLEGPSATGDMASLKFTPLEQHALLPGQVRHYLLDFQNVAAVRRWAGTVPASQYGLLVRPAEKEEFRIPGEYVLAAVLHLNDLWKAAGPDVPGDQGPVQSKDKPGKDKP